MEKFKKSRAASFAAVTAVYVLPAIYAIEWRLRLNLGSAVCLAISLFAVVMQATSDLQMQHFRRERKGGFIRTGL